MPLTLNRARTIFSDSPRHLDTNVAGEQRNSETPGTDAAALASIVFPV